MDMTMSSSTMGMHALVFLALWVIMMVAMMFPTAAPVILTFHKVQADKRENGDAFVSTWVFVAAYILVWTLAAVAAYIGALAIEAIAARAALTSVTAARIGGVVLVAAGIYQLTPLKDLCLSKCRTPITFIMTSWREGTARARTRRRRLHRRKRRRRGFAPSEAVWLTQCSKRSLFLREGG
jgi:predicted metal-binding membrane protein